MNPVFDYLMIVVISISIALFVFFVFNYLRAGFIKFLRDSNNQHFLDELDGHSEIEGTIISSDIEKIYRHIMSRVGQRPTYELKVKYKFNIDGVEYVSKNTSFSKQYTHFKDEANRLQEKYVVGNKVRVFYGSGKEKDVVAFVDDNKDQGVRVLDPPVKME